MIEDLRIRTETPADVDAIAAVTEAAFRTLAISHHTEQFIVAALRAASALTISLVAETKGRIVGHVAFSPITLSDHTPNWFGLGPVSVEPSHQRQGIGQMLIDTGLSRLKAQDAKGCCVVGHPDYYTRFGFTNTDVLVLEGVRREFFFVLPFSKRIPKATVQFHPAFNADVPSEQST